MKNLGFLKRLEFAVTGIREGLREKSFRIQLVCAAAVIATLAYLKPAPISWAILLLCVGLVLSAELFNTALESTLDKLHPESHPSIRRAKDCAAGAVLLISLTSAVVFLIFLFS